MNYFVVITLFVLICIGGIKIGILEIRVRDIERELEINEEE